MKKGLLITALFILISAGYLMAQKLNANAVPLAVKAELTRRYPDAKNVIWEKHKDKFKACWGGKTNADSRVCINQAGAFIQIVNDFPVKQPPIAITSYTKNHYNTPVIRAGKGANAVDKLFYEVEISGGRELIFAENGRFIRVD